MKTSQSIAKISVALLKAQQKIGGAKKGSTNPFFHSKYADLGEVMGVCKDPLNENGISVLQPVGITASGKQYVETVLLHESGEFISSKMALDIALRQVTPKTGEAYLTPDPQAQGSALTYARRYALQSMLFIPAEDDDAEKTMGGYTRTQPTYTPRTNYPKYTVPQKPATERVNSEDIPF